MENLSLDAINPKEVELHQLANDFNGLTIAGPDDKEGYAKVHQARMTLRAKRVEVEKTGKALREQTTAFNKAVINKEKELIGIIEPVETKLKVMEEAIDTIIERRKRETLLPERMEKLRTIEIEGDADQLLSMDPEQFAAYFNKVHAEYLEKKAAALRADQDRLDAERRAKEEEDASKKRAEEDAEKEAKRKADEEARIEQAKKDTEERIAREAKEKADRDAAAAAEEEKKLLRKKKYTEFMKKHGVEGAPTGAFYLQREGNTITLFKRVDAITL